MNKRNLLLPILPCLALAACGPVATIDQTVTRTVKQKKVTTTQPTTTAQTQQQTETTQSTQTQQADNIVDCHNEAYYTEIMTSAKNMTCEEAAADLKAPRGSDGISSHFTTAGGFQCAQLNGGQMGGKFRCENGNRAYRFDFSD